MRERATKAQRSYIVSLAIELGYADDGGVLRSDPPRRLPFGASDYVGKSVDGWAATLTPYDAHIVIERLKGERQR